MSHWIACVLSTAFEFDVDKCWQFGQVDLQVIIQIKDDTFFLILKGQIKIMAQIFFVELGLQGPC